MLTATASCPRTSLTKVYTDVRNETKMRILIREILLNETQVHGCKTKENDQPNECTSVAEGMKSLGCLNTFVRHPTLLARVTSSEHFPSPICSHLNEGGGYHGPYPYPGWGLGEALPVAPNAPGIGVLDRSSMPA